MKIYSENRKAGFNYQILERYEAGLVLLGTEVKSIRMGRADLAGAYVVFSNGELFLVGAKVPSYQPKNASQSYNPGRSRKLLLKKKELDYLIGKSEEKGLTLLPLKLYDKNATIKLEFGIAKGKKKYDKRETIKKREDNREMDRRLKNF